MDALEALALMVAWGADEALEDAPVDRTRALPPAPVAATGTAALPPRSAPPRAASPSAAVTTPRATAATAAQALAERAETIEALREALAGFKDCPLALTATKLVFSDGTPRAGVVLVGEAPGAEEDLSGLPFVGASGKLLDRMLGSIGLDRGQVLITNLIPWRPPGNRAPTDAEVLMCLPFLRRHLQLLRPRFVVSLGALSSHALTGTDSGIRRLRGKWRTLDLGDGTQTRLLPTYHPAYLLRTAGAKREAWADLIALRQALNATGDPR